MSDDHFPGTSRPLQALAPETTLWRSPSITISRREALRLTAVAIAGAALGGCTDERTIEPPAVAAGKPSHYASVEYATTLTFQGIGRGAIARVLNERPVKIEGHPGHPGSRGASDPFMQASTLSLYDPFRLRAPILRNRGASNWSAFEEELDLARREADADRGQGLAILMAPSTSPTEARLLGEIRQRWPQARLHVWDPAPRAASARAGAELAFGRALEPIADLSQAEILVLFDADPLGAGPDQLRLARDWSTRRGTANRSRTYVAEPSMTLSGASADRRIAVAPDRIAFVAAALQATIDGSGLAPDLAEAEAGFVAHVAADLKRAGARGLVMVGPSQPPEVHAASFAITQRLGGVGTVLHFVESPEILPLDPAVSLPALNAAVSAGEVETLLILGVNPTYDAPAAPDLSQVRRSICLVNAPSETSTAAGFVLPLAHPLESWGDARAVDGTASLLQPTVRPLFEGRSVVEILALLLGRAPDGLAELRRTWGSNGSSEAATPPKASPEITRAYDGVVPDNRLDPLAERAVLPPPDPATDSTGPFAAMLSAGFLAGSAFPAIDPGPARGVRVSVSARAANGDLTLVFRPDPTVWAGEFAGNAWLQELPKPLTRLAWSNALLLSPATAAARGLSTGDVVSIEAGGRSITASVLVSPGEADNCGRLDLGYGRLDAGPVGSDLGADAARLRDWDSLWARGGARIARIGETTLVRAQAHASQEGQPIVRKIDLAALASGNALPVSPLADVASDYYATGFAEAETVSWGMTIDLDRCIGCGACVTACQAENNIPVVGPVEVERGRSMHWIRVDRYVDGPPDDPSVSFQPVPCMHCENAPCEPVCPVGASIHDDQGLNNQVYNRCIGTRFCQANCPYQVRRFNFLDYPGIAATTYSEPDWYAALVNPDVTVRARGVMEKCTFCVQRLRGTEIAADVGGGPSAEPQTACQQACPTQAIGFGDLKRPGSLVAALKASPRNYALLDDLGTKPRTTYLAKIVDPAAKGGAA